MLAFIGLDPGKTGACVILTEDRHYETYAFKSMGKEYDERDFLDWLQSKKLEYENDGFQIAHAFVEQVAARPGQGVVSMFSFGRSYGSQRCVIAANKIPFTLVTPAKWTKEMHQGIPSHLKTKDRSEIAVSRLYPDFEPTEPCTKAQLQGVRDALLLAEYGLRGLFHDK